MSIETATNLSAQLALNKQIITGSKNPVPPFPLSKVDPSAQRFQETVSTLWTWYSEALQDNLQFLFARAERRENTTLVNFKRVLDDQRHSYQHTNFDRMREAKAWRDSQTKSAGESTDEALREAILIALIEALNCLISIAKRVRQDADECKAWRMQEQASPEGEMRTALTDIGINYLKPGPFKYAVRRFKSHPHLKNARTPAARAEIAMVIALELNKAPLSVGYNAILDEFGLVGDPLARALLLVAHGIEAAGHRSNDLLLILEKTWPVIQKQR